MSSRMSDSGFTLVELLVALTIAAIVMGSVVKMFTSMSFGFTAGNSRADLQQSIRAVADLMSREIRMAGFSEHGGDNFGLTGAEANMLSFSVDWDNDGIVTASHSDNDAVFQESDLITYVLDSGDKSLRRITAEGTQRQYTQALLGGVDDHIKVENLAFIYRDQKERETSVPADVRSVELTITAGMEAGRKGVIRTAYKTKIMCRNLGL